MKSYTCSSRNLTMFLMKLINRNLARLYSDKQINQESQDSAVPECTRLQYQRGADQSTFYKMKPHARRKLSLHNFPSILYRRNQHQNHRLIPQKNTLNLEMSRVYPPRDSKKTFLFTHETGREKNKSMVRHVVSWSYNRLMK